MANFESFVDNFKEESNEKLKEVEKKYITEQEQKAKEFEGKMETANKAYLQKIEEAQMELENVKIAAEERVI